MHRVRKEYPQYEFGDKSMVHLYDLQGFDGPFPIHSFDKNRTVEVHIRNTILPMSTSAMKRVEDFETGEVLDDE